MWPVPVVIMKEVADNKIGFLVCLKVMLPDTVFFDRLVECFDIRVLVRSILSSNFMPYSIHLQCIHKPNRCVPPSLLVVRLAEGRGGGMTPSGNLSSTAISNVLIASSVPHSVLNVYASHYLV